MISIALATEDNLSEEIGRRLIGEMGTNFEVGLTFRKGGYGYLKSSIKKFYSFSKTMPLLLIADLDKAPCANFLISKWIGDRVLPEKFLFRVAVREIEAWLLADHAGMKNLLGPGGTKLPRTPDSLLDPKQVLLNFARKAPAMFGMTLSLKEELSRRRVWDTINAWVISSRVNGIPAMLHPAPIVCVERAFA